MRDEMIKLYSVVGFILRKVFRFPAHWVNKDTIGAVIAIVGVSLVLMAVCLVLPGCYGGMAYAKYHHNSSIVEERDANTSDRVGGCGMIWLGPQKYAPQMHVCIDREITDKPVFGHTSPDIVGDVQIKQPLYMWGRK